MLVFNTIYRKKLNIVFIFCVQPEKGGGGGRGKEEEEEEEEEEEKANICRKEVGKYGK